jgi:hypothetical protein
MILGVRTPIRAGTKTPIALEGGDRRFAIETFSEALRQSVKP